MVSACAATSGCSTWAAAGAVLLLVARRLAEGRAVGVDLWRGVDQSGNHADATRRNAEAEGVSDRVELCTGDMTDMPFVDGEFDLVLSSLAIHNITSADGRAAALGEALRAVRPGGRLAIVDFRRTKAYAARLAADGRSTWSAARWAHGSGTAARGRARRWSRPPARPPDRARSHGVFVAPAGGVCSLVGSSIAHH